MDHLFKITFSIVLVTSIASAKLNNRPIIGVITQETDEMPNSQMINAAIVTFLEGSGARVVPIFINRDLAYYEHIFNSTNGVLFPGGDLDPTPLFMNTGYARSAKIMFTLAVEANKRGDYYPIWGTCLGFETLLILGAKSNWLTKCNAWNEAAALAFTMDPESLKKTKLFRNANDRIIEILRTQNVTVNYHHYCLTPKNFTASGSGYFFQELSTNRDSNGIPFVSSVEAIEYPFYGVHFHPEFVIYDFSESMTAVPHTEDAVYVSQYFTRFFVNESRKNFHKFANKTEEDLTLIYNYKMTYTGITNKNRPLTYYFPV